MELIIYTLRSISSAIIASPLVIILAILMILLHLKNKKTEARQRMIIGGKGESAVELTFSQFVFGIVGGTVGSIILSELGVRFSYESGIHYLFFISLVLMFGKSKYICFSYSAGILGIISIFFELFSGMIPQNINTKVFEVDIVYLLLFVGTLHIIEGILVMIDGSRGCVPVFKESDNEIIGGYMLKRYWLMPISMIFTVMNSVPYDSIELCHINMPYWWELINRTSLVMAGIIAMVPFYAVIGYSSVTFTKSKRKKALTSGIHIFIYGVCVIIISQVARLGIMEKLFAVIFTPLAHELMLRIQRKSEQINSPLFVSDDGLVILDISRDSQMNQYGLEIGDRILSVSDSSISSEKEIYEILKKNLYRVNIAVRKNDGRIKEFMYIHDKSRRLGVLLVPKKVSKNESDEIKEDSFKTILEAIKKASDVSKNN